MEPNDTESARLRHCMVDEQLRARGIADEMVLAAMETIPRHLFVPASQRHCAYTDGPLPIGLGQTISQPYMVARMIELMHLTNASRVLEIGTGSGYQAAVLAELAGEVWTLERLPELAHRAEAVLQKLGYENVHVVVGDGTLGYSQAAPFDAIVVAAAAPHVPKALCDQLKPGGRMVIPVTARFSQDLTVVERLSAESPSPEGPAPGPEFRETTILGCVFVPLVGKDGYQG